MTCSELQEVLPELLDVPAEERYPAEFQSHLRDCTDCSELVSDLRSISGEAHHLAANDEPSPLLWLRISAQLRSEGIIRDQASKVIDRGRYRPHQQAWWRLSWLAPVVAVLLVAGTYVIRHRPTPVAERKAPSSVANPTQNVSPVPAPQIAASPSSDAPKVATKDSSSPNNAIDAGTTEQLARTRAEESAPSSDDEQFLSVVSTHAPAMKVTYEKQLQAVNADIRETQAYVDQNPSDADARQHLMDAYQQKALLYQIGLDRIQ
jgi:hypothetical protein